MKKIIKQFILSITLILVVLNAQLVLGEDSSTYKGAAIPESALDLLQTVNKSAGEQAKKPGGEFLPTFEAGSRHKNASMEKGASNITSSLLYGIDFIKYAVGTIAVFMIILSGLQLVMSGREEAEEEVTKQKKNLRYAVYGLGSIIFADQVVNQVLFSNEAGIFDDVEASGLAAVAQMKGVYNLLEIFAASVAILFIIINAFRIVSDGSNEENVTKAQKEVVYALIGLATIGLSEVFVKDILFKDYGKSIDVAQGKIVLAGLSNFIASFVGIGAFLSGIYGGYLYVASGGEEEQATKAKKILQGAVIGLILAFSAYAIATTLLNISN